MSKSLLYIIFITKDRKSHYVWNKLYTVGDLQFFPVIVVQIDGLSYTRSYSRQYNDISHYDYFRLQE